MTEDTNPIDRIFVEDQENRPDEIVVENLTTMDAEEFVERLESLAQAAEKINTLTADIQQLRATGLTDDDAKNLLFGRNSQLGKRDIEAMFDAIDALVEGHTKRSPTEKLLSDVSGLNLSETSQLMDELERLNRNYGDLDNE